MASRTRASVPTEARIVAPLWPFSGPFELNRWCTCGRVERSGRAAPQTWISVPVTTLLCLVIAISDGDTLTARCNQAGAYRRVTVRVAAIDAPETKQAFGLRSKQNLARLCLKQQAKLQPLQKDDYGRTVANVRCSGQDVATAQVSAGLAWVYTPYAKQHPQLQPLQQRAQARQAGLWSQKRPQAPWTYRHRQHPR